MFLRSQAALLPWSFWLAKLNCECCPSSLLPSRCHGALPGPLAEEQMSAVPAGEAQCKWPALSGSRCISHMLNFQLAQAICRERMGSQGIITEMGLPSSAVKRIVSSSNVHHVAYAGMVIVSLSYSISSISFSFFSSFMAVKTCVCQNMYPR